MKHFVLRGIALVATIVLSSAIAMAQSTSESPQIGDLNQLLETVKRQREQQRLK